MVCRTAGTLAGGVLAGRVGFLFVVACQLLHPFQGDWMILVATTRPKGFPYWRMSEFVSFGAIAMA